MLETKGLTLTRRSGYYFQHLSLEVRPGELLLVYGARNSGKTQFIETIVGARAAAAGEIWLAGERIRAGLPQPLQRVGYSPQGLGLWPDLTGEETIGFFTGYNQLLSHDLKINWQLEDAWNKRVDELEGPLRQRLNLAVSLTGNAPLVVWDEPLATADPVTRGIIAKNIKKMLQVGKIVILTTAFWSEVADLAGERVLYLRGNQAQLVTAAEIAQLAGREIKYGH